MSAAPQRGAAWMRCQLQSASGLPPPSRSTAPRSPGASGTGETSAVPANVFVAVSSLPTQEGKDEDPKRSLCIVLTAHEEAALSEPSSPRSIPTDGLKTSGCRVECHVDGTPITIQLQQSTPGACNSRVELSDSAEVPSSYFVVLPVSVTQIVSVDRLDHHGMIRGEKGASEASTSKVSSISSATDATAVPPSNTQEEPPIPPTIDPEHDRSNRDVIFYVVCKDATVVLLSVSVDRITRKAPPSSSSSSFVAPPPNSALDATNGRPSGCYGGSAVIRFDVLPIPWVRLPEAGRPTVLSAHAPGMFVVLRTPADPQSPCGSLMPLPTGSFNTEYPPNPAVVFGAAIPPALPVSLRVVSLSVVHHYADGNDDDDVPSIPDPLVTTATTTTPTVPGVEVSDPPLPRFSLSTRLSFTFHAEDTSDAYDDSGGGGVIIGGPPFHGGGLPPHYDDSYAPKILDIAESDAFILIITQGTSHIHVVSKLAATPPQQRLSSLLQPPPLVARRCYPLPNSWHNGLNRNVGGAAAAATVLGSFHSDPNDAAPPAAVPTSAGTEEEQEEEEDAISRSVFREMVAAPNRTFTSCAALGAFNRHLTEQAAEADVADCDNRRHYFVVGTTEGEFLVISLYVTRGESFPGRSPSIGFSSSCSSSSPTSSQRVVCSLVSCTPLPILCRAPIASMYACGSANIGSLYSRRHVDNDGDQPFHRINTFCCFTTNRGGFGVWWYGPLAQSDPAEVGKGDDLRMMHNAEEATNHQEMGGVILLAMEDRHHFFHAAPQCRGVMVPPSTPSILSSSKSCGSHDWGVVLALSDGQHRSMVVQSCRPPHPPGVTAPPPPLTLHPPFEWMPEMRAVRLAPFLPMDHRLRCGGKLTLFSAQLQRRDKASTTKHHPVGQSQNSMSSLTMSSAPELRCREVAVMDGLDQDEDVDAWTFGGGGKDDKDENSGSFVQSEDDNFVFIKRLGQGSQGEVWTAVLKPVALGAVRKKSTGIGRGELEFGGGDDDMGGWTDHTTGSGASMLKATSVCSMVGKLFAVKMARWDGATGTDAMRLRRAMYQEIAIAASLPPHPSIVRFFGAYEGNSSNGGGSAGGSQTGLPSTPRSGCDAAGGVVLRRSTSFADRRDLREAVVGCLTPRLPPPSSTATLSRFVAHLAHQAASGNPRVPVFDSLVPQGPQYVDLRAPTLPATTAILPEGGHAEVNSSDSSTSLGSSPSFSFSMGIGSPRGLRTVATGGGTTYPAISTPMMVPPAPGTLSSLMHHPVATSWASGAVEASGRLSFNPTPPLVVTSLGQIAPMPVSASATPLIDRPPLSPIRFLELSALRPESRNSGTYASSSFSFKLNRTPSGGALTPDAPSVMTKTSQFHRAGAQLLTVGTTGSGDGGRATPSSESLICPISRSASTLRRTSSFSRTTQSQPSNGAGSGVVKVVWELADHDFQTLLFPEGGGRSFVAPGASAVIAPSRPQDAVPSQPHSESQLIGWLVALLQGVQHLHRFGVIHRDIKPANILVFDGGARVALSDFGAGCFDSNSLIDSDVIGRNDAPAAVGSGGGGAAAVSGGGAYESKLRTVIGSPAFAAPEVLDKWGSGSTTTAYSGAADVWSLGAVFRCALLQQREGLASSKAEMVAVVQGRLPSLMDILETQLSLPQPCESSTGTTTGSGAAVMNDKRDAATYRSQQKKLNEQAMLKKRQVQATRLRRFHPKLLLLIDSMMNFSPQRRVTASQALYDSPLFQPVLWKSMPSVAGVAPLNVVRRLDDNDDDDPGDDRSTIGGTPVLQRAKTSRCKTIFSKRRSGASLPVTLLSRCGPLKHSLGASSEGATEDIVESYYDIISTAVSGPGGASGGAVAASVLKRMASFSLGMTEGLSTGIQRTITVSLVQKEALWALHAQVQPAMAAAVELRRRWMHSAGSGRPELSVRCAAAVECALPVGFGLHLAAVPSLPGPTHLNNNESAPKTEQPTAASPPSSHIVVEYVLPTVAFGAVNAALPRWCTLKQWCHSMAADVASLNVALASLAALLGDHLAAFHSLHRSVPPPPPLPSSVPGRKSVGSHVTTHQEPGGSTTSSTTLGSGTMARVLSPNNATTTMNASPPELIMRSASSSSGVPSTPFGALIHGNLHPDNIFLLVGGATTTPSVMMGDAATAMTETVPTGGAAGENPNSSGPNMSIISLRLGPSLDPLSLSRKAARLVSGQHPWDATRKTTTVETKLTQQSDVDACLHLLSFMGFEPAPKANAGSWKATVTSAASTAAAHNEQQEQSQPSDTTTHTPHTRRMMLGLEGRNGGNDVDRATVQFQASWFLLWKRLFLKAYSRSKVASASSGGGGTCGSMGPPTSFSREF